MYDVIIAGGGPAGLTAGIYIARAGLKAAVIERSFAGGQMAISSTIENYPGYAEDTPGAVLANSMKIQTERVGAEIISADITEMDILGETKVFKTDKGDYSAPTAVLAMGAVPRHIGVPGEEELIGSGVSFCATCDGSFFKGRDVAVVGGGNTALEDALYLAKICNTVYLIHRRTQFRAQHKLNEMAFRTDNIKIMTPYSPIQITGKFSVESITVEQLETHEKETLPVSGVFMAVGQIPKSELIKGVIDLDPAGYIIADESCCTNVRGVFCAGDIRTKTLRQIVTATADGAVAATAAEEYLMAYMENRP